MTEHPHKAVMDYPRRDAADKLRGRTKYTVDMAGQDVLHAVLVRSDVAAGVIRELDLTVAEKMPGVRAVASAADAPGLHGLGIADHPIFARDLVRYNGEPVAAIAADTLEQAQAAAQMVKTRIDPITPVLTMADALAADARDVHPDWQDYEVLVPGAKRGGNVAWEASVIRGDIAAAFARDDVTIVEGCYRVGPEPCGLRAAVGHREL